MLLPVYLIQSMETGTRVLLTDCRELFVSQGPQNMSEDKTIVEVAFIEVYSAVAEAVLV